MKTSESITKIAAALSKAQANIGAAAKGSANPFFKSKYADLGAVMEVVKQPLLDEGISVLQPVGHTDSGATYVETVLLHESGEFISDRMLVSVAKQNDPQAQGSAITYSRRYSLQSMLLVPSEDDDGEAGMDRKKEALPKKEPIKKHVKQLLLEALGAAGYNFDDFKVAMIAVKKLPEAVADKSMSAMSDETAQKFLDQIGDVNSTIAAFKAAQPENK